MDYEIVNILDATLGQHKSYSNSEYYYFCPFCHHYNPKLAVNIAKRKWQCWKCSQRGSTLLSLLRKLDVSREQIQSLGALLNDEIQYSKVVPLDDVRLTLPSEFMSLADSAQSIEYTKAMRYLTDRGITFADILRYNIGYCTSGPYRGRIIVPTYNADSTLAYFVGRDYHGTSYLKYMNPKVSKNIVGFENQINWKYPIIICEGVFDAMAIKRNAVPQLGTHLPKRLQKKILQQSTPDVYIALDSNALKDTIKIAHQLMKEGKRVHLVELDNRDPSSMGFEEMQTRIRHARMLSFVDLVQLKLRLSQL